MLDLDLAPVPISTEARAKARQLRRRAEAEDDAYARALAELLDPIRRRLAKFPRRTVPPRQLAALIEGWRFMPCRDFRLDLDARLERTRAGLIEKRIVAGRMRRHADEWVGEEEDLAAIEVVLAIDHHRLKLTSKCIATFSLHAISRRLQRATDSTIEALMHDLATAAAIDHTTLEAGGYKIVTHRDGGGWRGRTVRQRQPNGESYPVLSIRTWLSD